MEAIAVPDTLPKVSDQGGLFNFVGGILTKAADTAGEIALLRESNKQIGSNYPTGNTNPERVQSGQVGGGTVIGGTTANLQPYILGGAAVLLGGFLILALVHAGGK